MRGKGITGGERIAIVEGYKGGRNVKDIADEVNLSERTVADVIEDYNNGQLNVWGYPIGDTVSVKDGVPSMKICPVEGSNLNEDYN